MPVSTARGAATALAVLLFALALTVGMSGMGALPVDEHEALVLRTTEEMAERGDWIVPWFNDLPRLNKPPLSYWLTGVVAAAAGTPGAVAPWHGRFVSLCAGLAIVLVTAALGTRLYGDRRAGLLAALLTATTAGWFAFTHDARPDMLYAALCLGGFAAFALSATDAAHAPPAGAMLVMWMCYALAVLAKGPHIPALLLAGCAWWMVRQGAHSGALKTLRWGRGVGVVLLLCLPWWLSLQARLPADAVGDSQLGGSLLRPGFDHLFNGYYLYRPLQLLLPWLPLLPVGWFVALRDGDARGRRASYLLAAATAAVVLGLSLGPQQRYFYLLPAAPLLVLLGVRGWILLAASRPRTTAVLFAVQGSVVIGAAGWAFTAAPGGRGGVAALLAAAVVALILVRALRRLGCAMLPAVSGALAGVAATVFVTQADGTLLWSRDRFDKHELAAAVAVAIPRDAPLLSYALTPVVYVYELGRGVPRVTELAVLVERLAELDSGCLYVLSETRHATSLARLGGLTEIAAMPARADDRAALYCLARSS
ncbi:MAG: ArnT family glycosyltransferase [Gammaproteobacteria bacterium]